MQSPHLSYGNVRFREVNSLPQDRMWQNHYMIWERNRKLLREGRAGAHTGARRELDRIRDQC